LNRSFEPTNRGHTLDLYNPLLLLFLSDKLLSRQLDNYDFGELFALEAMMKQFIKNMSKEDKQKMMQEFMNSMTEEERTEMIQLMMPIMMKNMKPSMTMSNMMKNFDENECKKMMMEMSPEMRENCKKMMAACLKACE
jgi:hypothetical protein